MIYKIQKKQIICTVLALIISLCATGILTEAKVTEVQKKMADEVFRFHVLANSDSEKDQALKMKVIQTGVETIDDVNRLKAAGCDAIQGYYYSKPLATSDYIAFIEQHKND